MPVCNTMPPPRYSHLVSTTVPSRSLRLDYCSYLSPTVRLYCSYSLLASTSTTRGARNTHQSDTHQRQRGRNYFPGAPSLRCRRSTASFLSRQSRNVLPRARVMLCAELEKTRRDPPNSRFLLDNCPSNGNYDRFLFLPHVYLPQEFKFDQQDVYIYTYIDRYQFQRT